MPWWSVTGLSKRLTTEIVWVAPSIRLTEGKARQEEPANDTGIGSARKRDAPRIEDGRRTATREAAQGGESDFLRYVRSLVRAREARRASTDLVTNSAAFDGDTDGARGADSELCVVRPENVHPDEERIRELFHYNEWVADARTGDDKRRVDVTEHCHGGAATTNDTRRGRGEVLD